MTHEHAAAANDEGDPALCMHCYIGVEGMRRIAAGETTPEKMLGELAQAVAEIISACPIEGDDLLSRARRLAAMGTFTRMLVRHMRQYDLRDGCDPAERAGRLGEDLRPTK